MQRANSLEKTPILGKIEGRRRRGQQRMRWMDGITNSVDMNLGKLQWDSEGKRSLVCCQSMGLQRVSYDWATEQVSRLIYKCKISCSQVALVVKKPAANAGDLSCGFDPWVGKVPWRRAWQSTPVFLPGKPHGERSLTGYKVHRVATNRSLLKLLNTQVQR